MYEHLPVSLWQQPKMPPGALSSDWYRYGRRMVIDNGAKITIQDLDTRSAWHVYRITLDEGELPVSMPDYLVRLCLGPGSERVPYSGVRLVESPRQPGHMWTLTVLLPD